MVHCRVTEFEAIADRLQLSIPYLTHGTWTQPLWSGRNNIHLNRLFVPIAAGTKPSWVCNHSHSAEQNNIESNSEKEVKQYLKPGKSYLMPAGTDLSFHFEQGLVMVAIHFTLATIPGIDYFSGQTVCKQHPINDYLRQQLEKTIKPYSKTSEVLITRALLEMVLADYVDEPIEEFKARCRIDQQWSAFFHYVDNNLGADLRIPMIAHRLGLTATTLSKRFRREFGQPLKNWLMGRLQALASDRLLGSGDSIVAIAEDLRFSSEFHFSRFFRRATGLSPSHYRERLLWSTGS